MSAETANGLAYTKRFVRTHGPLAAALAKTDIRPTLREMTPAADVGKVEEYFNKRA